MRDIVTASYNHTPKSGTLHKNEYKSYKDFLENYSDAKIAKDDVESISSTDSGISSYKLHESKSNNTSTSSLNSDGNGSATVFSKGESTPTAFMGGNRTGSFRNYLDTYNNKKFHSVKPVLPCKPNATLKTEIVIQVSDPLDLEQKTVNSQKTVLIQIPQAPLPQSVSPPYSRSITPPNPTQEPKNNSIPPPPPPLPILQETKNIPPPPPMLGLCNNATQQKKWATVETETSTHKTNDQPKIPKSNIAAANLAKILNEHVLRRRKLSNTENSPSPVINNASTSINCENSHKQNGFHKSATLPRPTPTPQKSQVLPKLPPSLPRVQRSLSPKSSTNGISNCVDSVDYCTTTVVPVADASATINKGDPNVKKLVYNTYRGLLGAYNNKANDMISTLPRSMVREDKGVAKQVESISLQCRLDKLNGRINPKLEQE